MIHHLITVHRRAFLFTLAGAASAIDTHQFVPKFFARTLDGEKYNNDTIKGKVLLIQFWATWCPKCRSDQDSVDVIAAEYAAKGVVVLAVDVGESKRKVTDYLRRAPRSCKIVLNQDTNLPAQFEARVFPYYVVINADGKVAGEQKGAGGERALRELLRRAGVDTE